jgi:tRNA(adenine34) deaminase
MNNFMQEAIEIAKASGADVPVGALVVKNKKIIAYACNEREKNSDITAHAEILAIKKAAFELKNWRLDECELYVTLEPCPMCAWAILESRIGTVYFGSYDEQYGALGSKIDLRTISKSKLKVYGGILEEECNNIISEFWQEKRKNNK